MIPGQHPVEQGDVVRAEDDAGILFGRAPGNADNLQMPLGTALYPGTLRRIEKQGGNAGNGKGGAAFPRARGLSINGSADSPRGVAEAMRQRIVEPAIVSPCSASAIITPKGARPAAKLPVPSIGSISQTRPEPRPCSSAGSAAQASSPTIRASGSRRARPSASRSSLSLSAIVTSSSAAFSMISCSARLR